jgi:hypothetical protein
MISFQMIRPDSSALKTTNSARGINGICTGLREQKTTEPPLPVEGLTNSIVSPASALAHAIPSPARGGGSGWGCAERTQNAVELVDARIVKCQHTAAFFRFEGDAQPEGYPEFAFERHGVRITRAPLRRWCFGPALHEPLGGADVKPASHDSVASATGSGAVSNDRAYRAGSALRIGP